LICNCLQPAWVKRNAGGWPRDLPLSRIRSSLVAPVEAGAAPRWADCTVLTIAVSIPVAIVGDAGGAPQLDERCSTSASPMRKFLLTGPG